MYYAVLSDIHGNMYALESVVRDMRKFDIQKVILLGDLIDYGMQSNEVVDFVCGSLQYDIICNIWGNHERAVMLGDFTRFSSKRGEECARYTEGVLTDETKQYLDGQMTKEGVAELELSGRRCLAVHGSLEDNYWKAVSPENVRGDYSGYDIVFSGHSHYSHVFTKFYDAQDEKRRGKHAVRFINPGSVGQPRNHDAGAQYALVDSESFSVMLRSVEYPVRKAMELYKGGVDDFYRARLEYGV